MSESIAVVCSACHARIKAPAAAAGRRAKCPKCQAAVLVPRALVADWRPDEPVEPAPEGPRPRPTATLKPVVHDLGASPPDRTAVNRKTLLVLVGAGFGGMLLLGGVLVGVLVARPWERAGSDAVAPRPAAVAPKAEPVSSVDEHEAVRKVVTARLGDEHFIAVVHSLRMGKCSVTDRKGVTYEADGVASASAENSKVPGLANDAELAKIHGEWRIIRVTGRNPR